MNFHGREQLELGCRRVDNFHDGERSNEVWGHISLGVLKVNVSGGQPNPLSHLVGRCSGTVAISEPFIFGDCL